MPRNCRLLCSFVLHGILRVCVSSLVSAMPKVKQGWKGGPPPARPHSTRWTRPPARLVEATPDSSDSNVDTDVLRATNSDLQRRVQFLEAQLSEANRSGPHPCHCWTWPVRHPPLVQRHSLGRLRVLARRPTIRHCLLVRCNICRVPPSSRPSKVSHR